MASRYDDRRGVDRAGADRERVSSTARPHTATSGAEAVRVGSSGSVELPSFGAFLQELRERARTDGRTGCGMSRAELAIGARHGVSYIAKLEQGKARDPSPAVVDDLATALGATEVERRHLHDLSVYRPSDDTSSPGVPEVAAANRAYVDALAPAISGFVDELWNVLYANSEYRRVFRHIADPDVANVLTWFFFVPESRRIMIEWEREALLTVSWLRALMVRGQVGAATVAPLLDTLARSREFVAMWRRGDIALSRHKPEMLLRDLDLGKVLHLQAQVLTWPDVSGVLQLYLGVDVGPDRDVSRLDGASGGQYDW